MNSLVSVIIPSYNHAQYIIETLNSVIRDSYKNKEIIILDDGSQDNSLQIIKDWILLHSKEVNIKLFNRENRGVCRTLNELIDLCTGDYILPLASDDLLTNDTITERIKILQNSGKMVVVSDAEVINEQSIITYKSMLTDFHNAKKDKYKTEAGLLDEILFNFAISGAVVMMDKKIFSLVGKYPEDLKGEDFYFYVSSAAANQIIFFDKVVSKYRIHSNNTSGINPALYFDGLKTYRRLFFKIPGFARKLRVLKRVVGSLLYFTLRKFKF